MKMMTKGILSLCWGGGESHKEVNEEGAHEAETRRKVK